MTAYEVQTCTLCDGWVNTWHCIEPDGREVPETFPTEAAAQAALDEFLAEVAEEIALGIREPDEGYDASEFRVAPAGA